MTSGQPVGAVIVTYNSGPVVVEAVEALFRGTLRPTSVVIVDNGSDDESRLRDLAARHRNLQVVPTSGNLGFCAANNIGLRAVAALPYVLILNPDAIVTDSFLERGVALLERDRSIGGLGPKLLGLDPISLEPTGRLDSTGIFQKAYGRIYDRGQGEPDVGQYDGPPRDVPALCAAAMLCRREALESVADGNQVFDEAFFMYKEDVDLSYRLRAAGWHVVLDPGSVVYHCRGNTQTERATTPPWVRKRSVANEWRLWRKGTVPTHIRIPMLGYLVAKSVALRLGR